MVELADALDSKSSEPQAREGSNPSSGMSLKIKGFELERRRLSPSKRGLVRMADPSRSGRRGRSNPSSGMSLKIKGFELFSSPFIKGGQRGISEIHPSLPFVKEGDLKLQGNFKKSPPTPLFPPTILPLYKRGIKGDFTKEGDLKLEGNFVKRGE